MDRKFAVLIVWINTCLVISMKCAAAIPAGELDALVQFKMKYIAKGSQHLLESWNTGHINASASVCKSWVGIGCISFASGYDHVQSITLPNFGLEGSIAPHLCNLTFLSNLSLPHNAFTGRIPPQFMGCTSLQVLQLTNNTLISPIPSSLTSLPLLIDLGLCKNSFHGPFPSTLLTNISTSLLALGLCDNAFTGYIPDDLRLHAPNLLSLLLWGNKLTGSIPPSLGNFSQLLVLDLSRNELTGPIPAELGMLHNLQTFSVFENSLTGVIPFSLGNCTRLVFLSLAQNQLTGPIPSSMSKLGQLETLAQQCNNLSGLLQHQLDFSNFTKMTVLSSSNNQLGGSLLPINFSKLQQIRVLDMGSNQFTGEIPWGSFVNCTFLYRLALSNNKLSGAIPSTLGRFGQLQYLYLQGNLLWGAIPEFSELHNVQALQLLELDLSYNNLNGSLPSSLSSALLTLAGYLNVSHNDFSGSLPPWLGKLDKVVAMDLSHNNFAGSIPASLGDCPALDTLVLSNNHLSGDLPPQLGSLSYLKLLDLSYNHLSGVLPSFLGSRLLKLQMLNVSFNSFTGPIPTDEGVFKHLTASSFQGNPGLCGRLLNKTCIDQDVEALQHHHHHSLLQLRSWRGILLAVTAFVSALVLITGLAWLLVMARRRFFSQPVDAPSNDLLHDAKRYTAKELLEATQGYSEVNLLGQGGLGVVYKGVLSDSGQVVAIKKLKDIDNGSEEALLKEMHILGKLRHRNLVQILGCVLNLDIKAIVLQYMANGSLEQYLDMHSQSQYLDQEPEQKKVSSLRYRLMVSKVAMGIAHALAYLHHGYGESIIHGDVKPGNILLDSDLEPHLADFGLAKLIQRGSEAASLTSDFKGSIGYMAPEYAYAGRVTTKVDVYSFGVVVLRMLTGKSPTLQVLPVEATSLHEWVKSKLKLISGLVEGADDSASWEELLDGAMVPVNMNIAIDDDDERRKQILEYKQSVRGLLRMALACTSHYPDHRPAIHDVLAYLTSQNNAILELDSHLNL